MVTFFKKSKKEEEKPKKTEKSEEKWFKSEGQLAIDVYQNEKELVIQSTIAGIKPEDLDIFIEGDRVSIKGKREKPIEEGERNYFYQECYWGAFSREIILPVEVDPSRAEASFKEGILTIRIPKIEREKKRKIEVKE
ncbi:Hsp20/alpha crystallin family protein [Patescibacteria group bacterium]|nr:Hsp20/alpha crystallin family protein [Patescibacteria group bacterium]